MENRPLPYSEYQEENSHSFSEISENGDSFDKIIHHMSQGLIFIDSQGLIRTYNPAAENLLGIPRSQALLHHFSDLFQDQLFGFSMKAYLQTAIAPRCTTVQIENRENEIREIEIETSFAITQKKECQHPHLGIIVLLRDITEIKQLQMIAHRSDRMKALGEMAALVAHEIHNPLAGIKGFVTLLMEDLKEFPKYQEMTKHILSSTEHLDKIVTNILNYSKPIQLELLSTDMNTLVDEVIGYVKMNQQLKSNISIQLHESSAPIFATVDSELLKSALLNLVLNAAQSMPDIGGKINIYLKNGKKETIIDIEDTGTGISAHDQKKLFKPFFTTKSGGHGFGLAEVHRIIHEHHGEITVESTEGKGSKFTIKIPKVAV